MSTRRPTAVRRVVVNGAFRPQRVTGQQRYAIEISDRLLQAGAEEALPGRFWAASPVRTWMWCLLVLPLRTWGSVLVSLTARAPVLHPRQVLAVHDLFVLTNPEWYSKSYVRSHVPLLRMQLRTAAAVVAVSQPVADQVVARARSGPITVAPNAPSDLLGADVEIREVFDRTGLDPDRYLLTIGSLDPRKNLPRLAAAWGRVPEEIRLSCPLAVVGGSASIYAKEEVEWPSGTAVMGYLSDADLGKLYRKARAVVFVSLAEGFGLPIVEAAAAGVQRLLLSDIEVFHWIAGAGAVYVDPSSAEDLADALEGAIRAERWPLPTIDPARFMWEQSAGSVLDAAQKVAQHR